MSYSFTVSGSTKDEAKQAVVAKFDEVVAGQSVHATDREQAIAAANAFIDMIDNPSDGEKINVSVNGSIGGSNWTDGKPERITSAGVNVSAAVGPV
jgi:hypothetical protein